MKGLLPENSEDSEPKDEELDFEKYELATSKDDLDTLATMADKIVEFSSPGSSV
jgi:hypothetical protein